MTEKKIYLTRIPWIFDTRKIPDTANRWHLYESDEFYEEKYQALHTPLDFICAVYGCEVEVFRKRGTKKYGYLVDAGVTGLLHTRITKYSKTRTEWSKGMTQHNLGRFSLYESDAILGTHDSALLMPVDGFLADVSSDDEGFKVFRKKGTKKYGYVVDEELGIIVNRFIKRPQDFVIT